MKKKSKEKEDPERIKIVLECKKFYFDTMRQEYSDYRNRILQMELTIFGLFFVVMQLLYQINSPFYSVIITLGLLALSFITLELNLRKASNKWEQEARESTSVIRECYNRLLK